jgi:hypothetical protein
MRMAGSVQPRAEETNHDSATSVMFDDDVSAFSGGVVTREEKPRLGGSIAIGILVGAVAAFLVGGLLGVHETVTGTVHLTGSSVIQPVSP